MKTRILVFTSSMLTLLFISACTKLDEKDLLYGNVTSGNFYKNDKELASAVGSAYTNLYNFGGNNHMIPLNEVTTDEVVVPTRGADWYDGGHWLRLQTHTYKSDDPTPNNCWNTMYAGIATCNRVLSQLEPLGTDVAKAYISELKALRAIYYYWLLDMFGNVPLSIDFSITDPLPNSSRKDVYDFVESELLANAPQLPKNGPGDGPYYGRVNYYTCYMVLAKLYLNAQVYTGTPQWDKAIAACDTIINSNLYTLSPNYKDVFAKNNTGNTEIIWAVPNDEVYAKGFNLDMMTLNPQNQLTYNISGQPWNGFATIQEFYQSYIDPAQNPGPQGEVVGLDTKGTPTTGTVDKRLSNFLVGPQYAANGAQLIDGGADASDPDGPPITFTPYINELQPNAWRQSGARIGKYEFYSGMTTDMSNDWVIFRYADVLLMKAEAIARKANNWNDPVTLALLNQVRTTHGGVDAFTTLDANKFIVERGREMFIECMRRQDLIRFGFVNDTLGYNKKWRFHPADADKHVNIFPIPANQINANPKLAQNPGY
jgi:hypothetical protein